MKNVVKLIIIFILLCLLGGVLCGVYILKYNNISIFEILSNFNIYFYSVENCPQNHVQEMKEMYEGISEFANIWGNKNCLRKFT